MCMILLILKECPLIMYILIIIQSSCRSLLAIATTFSSSISALDVHCHSGITNGCHVTEVLNIHEPTLLNFINADNWNDTTHFEFFTQSNIIVMPSGLFARFPKLTRVRIQTGLKTIQKDDFKNSNALQALYLYDNELTIIPNNVFSAATELFCLNIAKNRLKTIEDYAFSGLNKLVYLGLANNSLSILKQNTFAGAVGLITINLNDNRIETIENGAFDLPKLRNLHLSGNLIQTIPENVFAGAHSLTTIHMSRNSLIHIGHSFEKCPKLAYLDLNYNQINDIDLQSFANLPDLRVLLLKNAGFRFQENVTVEAGSVDSKLSLLDLSGNELANSDVLERLKNFGFVHLHNLFLYNNNFTVIRGLNDVRLRFPNIMSLGLSENLFEPRWIDNATEVLEMQEVILN